MSRSSGEKVVFEAAAGPAGLTLRELLVVAFAVGGEDAAGAVREALIAIQMLDGRHNKPGTFAVHGPGRHGGW
jgi:hypothetical protein